MSLGYQRLRRGERSTSSLSDLWNPGRAFHCLACGGWPLVMFGLFIERRRRQAEDLQPPLSCQRSGETEPPQAGSRATFDLSSPVNDPMNRKCLRLITLGFNCETPFHVLWSLQFYPVININFPLNFPPSYICRIFYTVVDILLLYE